MDVVASRLWNVIRGGYAAYSGPTRAPKKPLGLLELTVQGRSQTIKPNKGNAPWK